MGKPRKLHFPGSLLFVTASVEEGILLPCNPLMTYLVFSALATSQSLYPVRVIALLTSGTHIHLMLLVENPDDVKDFMGHFKTEYAHMVNRLLGRRKRTVWCEGYHSAPILTFKSALEKLVYLYTNPAKDGLESSIELYPGFSSYSMLKAGITSRKCKRIRRPALSPLPAQDLSIQQFIRIREQLKQDSNESVILSIDHDAWMNVFGISSKQDRARARQLLISEIKNAEARFAATRTKNNQGVLGAARLRSQGFDLTYIPVRFGFKAWCFCSGDTQLRKRFISLVKIMIERGKEVVERWRVGDYSVPFPLGLYPPSLPRLALPTTLFTKDIWQST